MAYLSENLPAMPVWLKNGGEDDEYVDFLPEYVLKKDKKYMLRIACDSDYSVYAGEQLIGFGQYSDYPSRVVYDDIDFSCSSDTKLTITAWHCGINSQTHVKHAAYAVFCLYEDGKVVYSSSEETKSRLSAKYVQHRKILITVQMGPGFSLEGRKEPEEAENSALADIGEVTVVSRPNRRLQLDTPVKGNLVRSGKYRTEAVTDLSLYMKNAELDVSENAAGQYYLFDLGSETVGFPKIEFVCDSEADVRVGWGEHIADGMCRVAPGSRRFSFGYTAVKGKNEIFPVLRRIGCRYMQIFIEGESKDVKIDFYPVIYPVKAIKREFSGIRQEIYDTAVHTLRCSMHEHYEDCPWREQALYALDSRNQMVAGYKVFEDGNKQMVRASLDLISRGVRPDGLLMLCYPAGIDFPIPFYTLAYFVQCNEYLEFSGDVGFVREKLGVLRGLMNHILSRMTLSGEFKNLVPRWDDSNKVFWNFYEWASGMHGKHFNGDVYDAPFNAMLVISLKAFSNMLSAAGIHDEAEQCLNTANNVKEAVHAVFASPDGLYYSYCGPEYNQSSERNTSKSVLTQALILQSGAADGTDKTKMLEVIANNGGYDTVPSTLSMACFRYDALLCEDKEKYKDTVLDEIDRDGEYMLSKGAITFWETIKGEADFNGAGSLCHGWSAMSAYYYSILL